MKDEITNPDGPSPKTLSTQTPRPGGAKRPGDTLDSGRDAPADAYDPTEDVGKAEPSGEE